MAGVLSFAARGFGPARPAPWTCKKPGLCRRPLAQPVGTAASDGSDWWNVPPQSYLQFRGVSWSAANGKWRARITANKKQTSLGAFDAAEDAARAYDKEALRLIQEGALPADHPLNFPAHEYSMSEVMAAPRKEPRVTTSRFTGVGFNARAGLWAAFVNVNGKKVHLGYFGDEEEAARARDRSVLRIKTKGTTTSKRLALNFPITEYDLNNLGGSEDDEPEGGSKRSPGMSGFWGVSWREDRKCWSARFVGEGVRVPLGHFQDVEEAARAYDECVKDLRSKGVISKQRPLNFPQEE